MVNKNNFLKGVLAAMVLTSPLAGAATQYPASDFKPKVLYSDTDYKHSQSAPAATAAKKADPRYPAADFQPKVLYKDSGYKHKADAVSAAPKASSSTGGTEAQPAAEGAKEGSDNTMLIGLIVLAAVGFYFLKGKKGAATQASSARPASRRAAPVYRGEAGGLTGVAKYLAGKEVKVTGVAKYLESKEQTAPATGVAKYMAKQAVAARQAAAERVTGVEKYLRNKG